MLHNSAQLILLLGSDSSIYWSRFTTGSLICCFGIEYLEFI